MVTELVMERSFHYAANLRRELSSRNSSYAASMQLPHALSYGDSSVVYKSFPDKGKHGNFLDVTYKAILQRPEWKRRLSKVHSHGRRSLPPCESVWYELDSSMSSDALLMNVFCHPGALRTSALRSMFGIEPHISLEFGFKARVPFANGRTDRTEVDM